jgi:hypothetical protein
MGSPAGQTQGSVGHQRGRTMNRIEILANEIAMLSNDSLNQLATILVEEYRQRADVLETNLNAAFFYNDTEIV